MRMIHRWFIVLGAVLLVVSLFADPIGIGRWPGFGFSQVVGCIVAILMLTVGFVVRARHGADAAGNSPGGP